MTTEAKTEARRTAIAIVRAAMDGDAGAGAYLASTAEDAGELMAALEGFAHGLTVATTTDTAPPAFHPKAFAPGSEAEVAATFDALVAFIVRHLDVMASEADTTPARLLDALAERATR